MKKVAVVYLARVAHGIDAFKPFAESYRKHVAGFDHDLVLLGKGMSKIGERAATEALFEGIPHRIIESSDDGFDIQAYLKAAQLLNHEFIFFCNTYTELATDNWLAKMMFWAIKPEIGIVGSSASFESLHDSQKLYNKVLWLTHKKRIRYDKSIAQQFGTFLDKHDPGFMAAAHSLKGRLRRVVGDLTKKRPKYTSALDIEFEAHWESVVTHAKFLRQFTPFPNPHIRSTAFVISRRLLLSFGFEVPNTKNDCALFESGAEGLSNSICKIGLRMVLVGANGKGYEVDQWPNSNTFRLGDQGNCITRDNHIAAYNHFAKFEKELHHKISWGEYSPDQVSSMQSLGIRFPKADSLANRVPALSSRARAGLRYSVVIPTHDRLELVKDAIETVRRQAYENWEIVVFDNCSSEPLREYVASLDETRIHFKRSDQFLPVTESWNTALNEATGDYVILIGDDDGLKPDFFERVGELIQQYKPDLIYSSILQFFHPGVAPWRREGYVTEVRNGSFFVGRDEPFLLDPGTRRAVVEGSLKIRRSFAFNMQSQVYSRDFIERLKIDGRFFHSPFPDYYIANVAFAFAKSVLVDPKALAIAGVSRASFGFTLFNKEEARGAAMLNSDYNADPIYQAIESELLPGPAYTTSYMVTMEHLARRLGNWTQVRPDMQRYRKMQIFAIVNAAPRGLSWKTADVGSALWRRLTLLERLWAVVLSYSKRGGMVGDTYFERVSKDLNPLAGPLLTHEKNIGDFVSTLQLFRALERGELQLDMVRERDLKVGGDRPGKDAGENMPRARFRNARESARRAANLPIAARRRL